MLLCLPYWRQSSENNNLNLTQLQYRMKIRITIAAELFSAREFHSKWSSEALTWLVLSCRLQHSTIFELHPKSHSCLCVSGRTLSDSCPKLEETITCPSYLNLNALTHMQQLKAQRQLWWASQGSRLKLLNGNLLN